MWRGDRVNKQKLQEQIQYLRSHPEAYVEMVTGRKLLLWQKFFIRMMDKIENRKYKGKIVVKNGSMIITVPTKGVVVRGNRSKYIYPVYHDENEGDVE